MKDIILFRTIAPTDMKGSPGTVQAQPANYMAPCSTTHSLAQKLKHTSWLTERSQYEKLLVRK